MPALSHRIAVKSGRKVGKTCIDLINFPFLKKAAGAENCKNDCLTG